MFLLSPPKGSGIGKVYLGEGYPGPEQKRVHMTRVKVAESEH